QRRNGAQFQAWQRVGTHCASRTSNPVDRSRQTVDGFASHTLPPKERHGQGRTAHTGTPTRDAAPADRHRRCGYRAGGDRGRILRLSGAGELAGGAVSGPGQSSCCHRRLAARAVQLGSAHFGAPPAVHRAVGRGPVSTPWVSSTRGVSPVSSRPTVASTTTNSRGMPARSGGSTPAACARLTALAGVTALLGACSGLYVSPLAPPPYQVEVAA